MDKSVFSEKDWKDYAAKNAVLVTLDFPKDDSIVPEKYKGRNRELQTQFGVGGYPTYVVLDTDGKSILGKLGAGRDKTPASFIKEFQGLIKLSAGSVAAYVKSNPDKADAYKKAISELKESKDALKTWLATRPKRTPENTKKFEAFNKRIKDATGKFETF